MTPSLNPARARRSTDGEGAPIEPSRRTLLTAAGVLAPFYLTDAAQPPRMAAVAMATRTAWIAAFVACALLPERLRVAWSMAVNLVLAGVCAAGMVLLALATGGSSGVFFGFVYAMPFAVGLLLPDPRAVVLASSVIVVGGVAMLSAEGQPSAALLRWAFVTSGAGAAAVYTAFGRRRAADAERARLVAEAELRLEKALREVRAELVRVSRFAAMGELTANVAHELSQPLGAILSNVEAALMLVDRDPLPLSTVREILDDILASDRRAVEVIQALREFAKRRQLSLVALEPGPMLREAVHLVEADSRAQGLDLVVDLAPDLPLVLGDRVHLVQVVLNLVHNAMESMAGSPGGGRRITVRATAAPGGLEVSVSDQGPGIPEALLRTIFDPFVTTKADGMGMGLSICRTVIQAHGGTITATSDPGGGATVRFSVPGTHSESRRRS